MTYLWWCGLLCLRIYFELNVTKEYSAKAHTKNYNILQKQHKVLLYKHAYPEIRGTSFLLSMTLSLFWLWFWSHLAPAGQTV